MTKSHEKRIAKLLSYQSTGIFGLAQQLQTMTDGQLMKVMLENAGLPSSDAEIISHLKHFDETGELPGGPYQHAA